MKRLAFLMLVGFLPLSISHAGQASAQTVEEHAESFEIVWQTINERFFDPDFNGVDWELSKLNFQSIVGSYSEPDSFYKYVNLMLFELGVSHTGVVPTDDPKQLGEASIFGEGTVGIEVRFIDEKLHVVSVAPASSAAKSGLEPGVLLVAIDGISVAELARRANEFPTPPFTDRNREYMALGEIYWSLYGDVGSIVEITYLNHQGESHTLVAERTSRGGQEIFDSVLPSTYVSFDSKDLGGGIGYLRFSSFHPALLDDMMNAVDQFLSFEGIIIDLRGNPGGAFGVRAQLASRFIEQRSIMWRYRGRNGIDDIYIEPHDRVFQGNLVILVDELSASSSEEFSGGLQALDIATVIGRRTPGRDVVMDITALPNNSYFIFPVAETMTNLGRVLEKNGVIPDLVVSHTESSLRQGIDIQLESAIELLRSAE